MKEKASKKNPRKIKEMKRKGTEDLRKTKRRPKSKRKKNQFNKKERYLVQKKGRRWRQMLFLSCFKIILCFRKT